MQKCHDRDGMSREKFFSKPVDDEKKQGQHKQEKGGGEEPAGIGKIKVEIIDGRGDQGIEGDRHGRENDHHLERHLTDLRRLVHAS